ncbi:MAG TPA: MipA/OmpV family protein, partial [Burkholderiales bacterium]
MRSPRGRTRPLCAAFALALCAAAPPAIATSDFLADVLTERGGAGWGMVTRFEQSPYRGGGVRFDLLPIYLYEGEYVYLHSYRAGLKFNFGSDKRVDAFLSRRLESYPVEEVPASLAGMSSRIPETDFGLSYEQHFDWGNVYGEALRDVSHNSGGAELRLGAGTERRRGRLRLVPYPMLSARNAPLNNYYYGVMPSEATADRPAYQPGAGVNGTAGLNARYNLTDRWYLL